MATTSHPPVTSAAPRRSTLPARIVGPVAARRTWAATWFLVSSFFAGAFWFTATITLVVTGAATVVIAVGIPLAMAAVRTIKAGGRSERRRVGRYLGIDIIEPAEAASTEGGLRGVAEAASDTGTRRTLFYLVALLPLGVVWCSIAIVAWTVPLGLLSTPALLALGIEPAASSQAGGWEVVVDTLPQAWAIAAVGVALLPLAPRVIRRMARAAARFATTWLTPTQQ